MDRFEPSITQLSPLPECRPDQTCLFRKTPLRREMPEYIQAVEQFLSDNPSLGKAALVQLLTARFPNLNKAEAWILVAHYCNEKSR